MKQSYYNVTVPLDLDRCVIFNTLSKKFFVCTNRNKEKFLHLMISSNEYISDERFKRIINEFADSGFIVDEDTDELSNLEVSVADYIKDNVYTLTVMTTYACNFACWYCVQKHKPISISLDVEQKIFNHIKLYVTRNDIGKVHIAWFGGEPLLNFNSIRNISKLSKEWCESQGIDFTSSITTNGSLLTKSMINEMVNFNFVSYQITIDGDKGNHNQTRFNRFIKDSFNLLLENIVDIVTLNPQSLVTLRINYTCKNLSESLVTDIDQKLHSVRKNVFILFRKVWQEPENEQMFLMVSKLINQFQALGYLIEHDYDNYKLLSCYVEKEHYLSVFPNGTVDKCNNKDIGKARGYIEDNGNVVWNENPKEMDLSVFSRISECRECKYLPICMGPCPSHRERMTNVAQCIVKDKVSYFNRGILEYCRIKTRYDL